MIHRVSTAASSWKAVAAAFDTQPDGRRQRWRVSSNHGGHSKWTEICNWLKHTLCSLFLYTTESAAFFHHLHQACPGQFLSLQSSQICASISAFQVHLDTRRYQTRLIFLARVVKQQKVEKLTSDQIHEQVDCQQRILTSLLFRMYVLVARAVTSSRTLRVSVCAESSVFFCAWTVVNSR